MKSAHGPDLKIGNRADYLAALEAHILTGSSPQDAIAKVGSDYGVTISKTTCYRYIQMKLFPSLRYKHLPQGHPRKARAPYPMPTCPTQNTVVLNTAQRVFETVKKSDIGNWIAS